MMNKLWKGLNNENAPVYSVLLVGFIYLIAYFFHIDLLVIPFGLFLVIFAPGYFATLAFFDKELDAIERIALSFGLSIALVPLSVFALNRIFAMPINFVSSFFVVVGLCVLFYLVYYFRK